MNLDWGALPSPAYVYDLARLEENGARLAEVGARTGARLLLALKAFAIPAAFAPLRGRLQGTAASSLWEARLGREEFGGEVHLCAPAYAEHEIEECLSLSDSITFNSLEQWERFRARVEAARPRVTAGLRVNPERSAAPVALYDPGAPGSRLGVTREALERGAALSRGALSGIEGLHVHALCEQGADALEEVVEAIEERFGELLPGLRWLNLGGGHHITRADYDLDRLCALLARLRDRYRLELILEPGEAVALDAGSLVATVLDVVHRDVDIAILDTSAAAHMPDVLEMPYRPEVRGAGRPGELARDVRLAGNTCLAGDVIGDYSFPAPLEPGDRVVFGDMAHYAQVKSTTFNGLRLPAIVVADSRTGEHRIAREFGYDDFRSRLS